ncbi:MAG: hypothetical protein ACFKPT_26300 [Gloeotrichia echinulata GP01]
MSLIWRGGRERDCTSGADATRSLLPRSGTAPLSDQGLGIGDCTSGADATRSLLPRSGTAPLCYQGLGIGENS